MVSDPKPGYLTTEFYITVLTQLFAVFIFVYTVVMHRAFVDADAWNAFIPTAAAIIAGVSQVIYSATRASIKTNHVQAQASVAVASIASPPLAYTAMTGNAGSVQPTIIATDPPGEPVVPQPPTS